MRRDSGLRKCPSRRRSEDSEFREFVAEFSPTLIRAAVLLLGDGGAAEDAVQLTLLRTFKHWRRARFGPEAYSRRVLINVCHDHQRHQRRHPVSELSDEVGQITSDEDEATRIGRRILVESALADLPAQQRETLVVRFFLDLSVSQTADLLGVPEGTVKSATHRGLEALRRALIDHDQEVRNGQR
jgi:RNA polymerase sigma-70 factor (sigma-E family)